MFFIYFFVKIAETFLFTYFCIQMYVNFPRNNTIWFFFTFFISIYILFNYLHFLYTNVWEFFGEKHPFKNSYTLKKYLHIWTEFTFIAVFTPLIYHRLCLPNIPASFQSHKWKYIDLGNSYRWAWHCLRYEYVNIFVAMLTLSK